MDLIFDFGNARGKWFNPRTNEHGDFRHAIVQLTDSQWGAIVGRRGKPPEGIIKVNGIPYAIGDAARRYVIPERPQGAARYRSTYYGVGLAYALASGFKRAMRSVTLFASHAPQDITYTDTLKVVSKARWCVESTYGEHEFVITQTMTFDEPLGGYSHFVFTEKGAEKKKNQFNTATVLVIDVGGYTVDVIAVDPGGEIDLMSARSTRTGVIDLTENFTYALRANNSTRFQDTGDIDIRRIENAILTGEFKFGKIVIDCHEEAQTAVAGLVNDVIQILNTAGGAANYDFVLLTGGGAALIYDRLVREFPYIDFTLAEPNRDLMKYANVFGGAKIAALLRQMGAL